jgi:outer membrane protein assembly factor BamD (BamD/ComL family)
MVALLFLALSHTARASDDGIEVKVAKAASEQYERDVDQVALASQENAIAKLQGLLKKYEKTAQEPVLLMKLAELEQQSAAILFRIVHGAAGRSGAAPDFSRFNRRMAQAISVLDRLIALYPSFPEIAHAYYLRGKGHEEIEEKPLATRDYLTLTTRFGDADETPSAYMALAQFAIDAGEHGKAVPYLEAVERMPASPHFPFALYKLAWAHYNLRDVPGALGYAERHAAFYRDAARAADSSDQALRENTLLDIALFYFQGYEDGSPKYPLSGALAYFRDLERGPVLGKMSLRFAKLLRSHEHDADLVAWKEQLLAEESSRPETLEAVLTTYEHQLNRRQYPKLVETAQDMIRLYKHDKTFEAFVRARKLLLDTAESFQTMIVKNKGTEESARLSGSLAGLYEAFTRIVEEGDPRIPKVHYNLAETLFTIRDYSGATEHYRWIVDHGNAVADAAVKAIASRYEVLRQRQLIPATLEARPIAGAHEEPLEPLLAEWIGWVDAAKAEEFGFEADRALYRHGHVGEAVARLVEFARSRPKSQYAQPSATLALDTYVAGQDWENARDLSERLLKQWPVSSEFGEFGKKLEAIAADSSYKLVEAEVKRGELKAALGHSDTFLARFGASARLPDTLALAASAATETGERDRALGYLTRLLASAPASANAPGARLARAAIEEDRYRFREASADLRAYLASPVATTAPKVEALREKSLALAWLAGEDELRAALAEKPVCPSETAACAKFAALLATDDPRADAPTALARARESTGEARAVWATVALARSKELPFRDRILATKLAAGAWDSLDPVARFALLPLMSEAMPRAFALGRRQLDEVAPLRADERSIRHRIEAIQSLEEAAAIASKGIAWARVRAELLNETAALYLDLAHGLTALAPAGSADPVAAQLRELVVPFEEKGEELRGKAFEAASKASIEDEPFRSIALPFFAENPSQARKVRAPDSQAGAPVALDLSLLARLDAAGPWENFESGGASATDHASASSNPALRIEALWARAIETRRWAQVAFFLHEAQEKALVQAGALSVMKAVSLASAGARAEGLSELEEGRRDLAPEARPIAALALVEYALVTSNRERAGALLAEVLHDSALARSAWVASAESYVK